MISVNLIVFLIILFWAAVTFLSYLKYRRIVGELNKSKKFLEESRAVLEVRVKARTRQLREQARSLRKENERKTQDLKKRIREMERFQNLTVGREIRMRELKKEVKKMEAQLRDANLKVEDYAKKPKKRKSKK